MTGPWIAAFSALAALVVVLGLVLLGLVRRIAEVLEEAESRLRSQPQIMDLGGLAPGTRVPPFDLSDAQGAIVSFAELGGEPFIAAILSPGCAPCKTLAEELGGAGDADLGASLVVITEDSAEGRALPLPSGLRVLYQRDEAASHALETKAYPFAFALDGDLTVIAKDTASMETLRQLAGRLLEGGDRTGSGNLQKIVAS